MKIINLIFKSLNKKLTIVKTIIRIEHADGWGMFRPKNNDRWSVGDDSGIKCLDDLWERHSSWNVGGMPIPHNDGIDMAKGNKEWFCAFKNIEEFKQWIKPEEMRELIKKNFKVLLLDVFDFQEGEKQVVYTKESILSIKDISQLFC